MKKVFCFALVLMMVISSVPALAEELTADFISHNAEYIDKYEDLTVAIYGNSVYAWGGGYGDKPVVILDNIASVKTRSGMYSHNSYYVVCEDGSLWVWGAHGYYTNKMPYSKPSKYTYMGGMLGLPCNYNVAPVYMGPSGVIDTSLYEEKTPDQKIPVKLLENVKEVSLGYGVVFALCNSGELYVWGCEAFLSSDTNRAPRQINDNASRIFTYSMNPAGSTAGVLVIENDGTLVKFSSYYKNGTVIMENVARIAIMSVSYEPVIFSLTDYGELWENKSIKGNFRILENYGPIVNVKTDGKYLYSKTKNGEIIKLTVGLNYDTEEVVQEEVTFVYTDLTCIEIYINSTPLKTDTAPYIKNDRTMVPMRAIFEALGATVTWDDATKTAIAVKGDTEVKITIGENVLYKNGEAIELDVAAEITESRTMVPVRAISEAFGCTVNWDDEMKTVVITR